MTAHLSHPHAPAPHAPAPGATRALRRGARLAACLLLLGGLAACAPSMTANTYNTASMGRAASVSYGTIVGLRPVTVQSGGPGLGTAGGAVAGGLAGSFIGGDTRSNLLGALGGAVLGGVVGNAVERGVGTGQAVEFFVREDRGGDIAVVQTNEENLQFNERVVIIRGENTRLSRAGGNAPPPGAAAPYGQPQQPYGQQPYGQQSGYGAAPVSNYQGGGYQEQAPGVRTYAPASTYR